MTITRNQNIGSLVAADYRTASVFKQHGIDFCCNGNRSIDEACQKKAIEPEALIEKLENAVNRKNDQSADYASWPLDLLADYIEKTHHRYVVEKIVEIKPFMDKVARVHGSRHPELAEINELFTASAIELGMHMKKEELVLFPFIRQMAKAAHEGAEISNPHFGSVKNPIQMMFLEHDTEGERFRKIAALSNNYTPPEDACNTYRVTFALLQEFEEDLHKHIHLENNILFPKAIKMEAGFGL